MNKTVWDKYAEVLVDYSVDVQKGDLVEIRSESVYAKDLVRAVYKRVLERGGHPLVRTGLGDMAELFIKYASDEQLDYVDEITKLEYEKVDKFIESPSDYGKPWYGQLMAGPQMLAYIIQIDYWLRHYNIKVEL